MAVLLSTKNSTSSEYITSEVVDLFKTHQVTKYELNMGNGTLKFTTVDTGDEVQVYKVPDVYTFIEKIDPYVEEYNAMNPSAPMEYNWVTPTTMPAWIRH